MLKGSVAYLNTLAWIFIVNAAPASAEVEYKSRDRWRSDASTPAPTISTRPLLNNPLVTSPETSRLRSAVVSNSKLTPARFTPSTSSASEMPSVSHSPVRSSRVVAESAASADMTAWSISYADKNCASVGPAPLRRRRGSKRSSLIGCMLMESPPQMGVSTLAARILHVIDGCPLSHLVGP